MAGPGSGLGASLGTAIETTYGTFVTPNLWHAVESCEIKRAPVYAKNNGLRGGATLVRSKNDRALTNQDAAGPLKSNWYYNGMGRWIGALFGTLSGASAATPTAIGATTARIQTHNWSSSWNQSLSIQQGIYDVSLASHNWQSTGVQIHEGQFECAPAQFLAGSFTLDCQDHFEVVSGITTPVEPTNDPIFSWANMQVKIGTFGQEVKVDGTKKWTGTVKRSTDDKRFNAGNLTLNPSVSYGIKDQPVDNNFMDIGGTLETEYLNDTLYENYFQTETPFSLIVLFSSTTLAGGAGQLTAGTAPTVTPTGGSAATSYFYKIQANSGTGSVSSAEGSTTTGVASLSSSSYNALSWAAVPGAQSYSIYRGPSANGENTLVATVSHLVTSFNDTGGGSAGTPAASNTATIPYWVEFAFPCCYFTGEDPVVNGPGVVSPVMPFEVWWDEVHAPAIVTYVNTDTSL